MRNFWLFLLILTPLSCFSQKKTIECYKTTQYGMIVEKCTYEMDEGDVLQFDNYEIYICQIQTLDKNGLKCQIKYKKGDVEINSNGIITPIIEEIPDEQRMRQISYKNDAWSIFNSNVLKITAHQKIKITVIKRIG